MIDYVSESPLKEPLIFDTHSHYDDKKFDDCRDELLRALPSHGVGKLITCGCDYESSLSALSLADKYDYVYAAVGLHPENLDSDTTVEQIEDLSEHKKCVAIGEIGLDYYWNKENRDDQMKIFENQLILANRLSLPVIVHDRDTHADTLDLLKKYKPNGVVHCFSGSVEMAKEILKLGMYLGVGGTVTFKNSKKLPDVVKIIPDDKILVETDCPYLAPEPYRGKINHSGMINLVAEKIANLRDTTTDKVLKQTYQNAIKLFKI